MSETNAPVQRSRLLATRRHFLSQSAGAVGIAALAGLLGRDAASASAGLAGAPHFPGKAKRVIYLFQSGGPSHLELFDYKPRLRAPARHRVARLDPHGPAPHRHDLGPDAASPSSRRISTSTAQGQVGAWLSELLPHTGRSRR